MSFDFDDFDVRARFSELDDRSDELRQLLRDLPDEQADFDERCRIAYIYHDSALEGAVLTYHELRAAVDRKVASDSSLIPTYQEIKNHADALDVIDTTKGTVHMVIGGGGTSSPSNQLLYHPPQGDVIVAVADRVNGAKGAATKVTEPAPWFGASDAANAYGFASFDVDPGRRGGQTTITVTYYEVAGPYGTLKAYETFTLTRPRGH